MSEEEPPAPETPPPSGPSLWCRIKFLRSYLIATLIALSLLLLLNSAVLLTDRVLGD